jgi:hypothetical protein
VNRAPIPASVAELCDTDTECSAMYTVRLSKTWTTGDDCNDIAMLPPHGRNQLKCQEAEADVEPEGQMWTGVPLADYTGHPFPVDGIKQSLAASEGSVTSLTESSVDCAMAATGGNQHCAFPLGYKTDTIDKHLGICVAVIGAGDKWVEIMGSSMSGSSGGSFCVRDRKADANQEGETGCTVSGDLIDIRESGNRPLPGNNNPDKMSVIFYAQDNTDDAAIDFQWRIAARFVDLFACAFLCPIPTLPRIFFGWGLVVVLCCAVPFLRGQKYSQCPPFVVLHHSYIRPTNREQAGVAGQEKDAEDWSMMRDGAGYPNSLMSPYPNNYNGTPVFETQTGSSASWTAPVVQLVLALVAMTVMLL